MATSSAIKNLPDETHVDFSKPSADRVGGGLTGAFLFYTVMFSVYMKGGILCVLSHYPYTLCGLVHMHTEAQYKIKQTGLTFLEIIFIITFSVIGIMIVLSVFGDMRIRARDDKRLGDITRIEKALSIYHANFSRFPISPEETTITGEDPFSKTLLEEFSIKKIPRDPSHPTLTYRYISNDDGSDYELRFCLETDNIPDYTQGCDNTVRP